jgi:hypothetical protein
LAFTPEQRPDNARHCNNWASIGRLRPGATIAQAQAQVDATNAANLERFPVFEEALVYAGFRTVVVPLKVDFVRGAIMSRNAMALGEKRGVSPPRFAAASW